MSALSMRAHSLLAEAMGLKEPTAEDVRAWIRENVPTGHNQLARMEGFLRRRKNCGEETSREIIAFAFGVEFLKRSKVRLTCSVCGEVANLQARGETCDKFTRWWVSEHEHKETPPA